ncbi:RNA polymerase sigma factor SigF [Yinghuangia seranimata]|uniref:RNA polymerase sigma factor SigF n=1 Tax=Yinghuangia seranimata TaxID=408067 RepID=UPI00248C58AF|nr:RNA polymerase sigma factor SigF [Yinghuangia seranimata]MDI2127784.1 RNA polymerase sigma factor SigF [Yinghuangia seranimata]
MSALLDTQHVQPELAPRTRPEVPLGRRPVADPGPLDTVDGLETDIDFDSDDGGPGRKDSAEVRRVSAVLFARLAGLERGTPEHAAVRDRLIEQNLPLVRYAANRFRHRNEPHEDVVQVGTIGLIKAIDRFDPDRGVQFPSYAMPTIIGEIKRYFRDSGWSLRVPRRVQELWLSLSEAIETLSQANDRAPTVAEMAAYLQVTQEEVVACLEATNAYAPSSLDATDGGDERTLADRLGYQDQALEGVEYREALRPLLSRLPARERKILMMRFFNSMSQSQIATELGISQMHVSRLLSRTLTRLRAELGDV